MKHTDLYDKIEKIRQQEIAELIEAVKAHGGTYNWDDDEEKPIVAINPDIPEPNPKDVLIESVRYDEDRGIILTGSEKVDGYSIDEILPYELFPGELSVIIDYIPRTEIVSDVSQKEVFFKITSVSRDDLEARGFDTENINDSEMSILARKMADDYCGQLFWDSMEIIAEDLGFPRKWDKWFKGIDYASMEKITGYQQSDFSSENDFRDFVDACEIWWNELPTDDREELYISNTENN